MLLLQGHVPSFVVCHACLKIEIWLYEMAIIFQYYSLTELFVFVSIFFRHPPQGTRGASISLIWGRRRRGSGRH